MTERELLKLEAKMHNPRFANEAGQQSAIILTPSELTDLIAANRALNSMQSADKEG